MKLSGDDIKSLALAIGGPLVGGQIAALISAKGLTGWYKRLRKPKWTPPDLAFGLVWPVLYTFQGVASWLVWKNKGAKKALPLGLYGAQLFCNLIWQPIMFKFKRPDIALVDSCAMVGLAAAATVTMSLAAGDRNSKIAVAALMTPYVGWLAFATALNGKIWKDNPNAQNIDDTPIVPKEAAKAADKAADAVKKGAQEVRAKAA